MMIIEPSDSAVRTLFRVRVFAVVFTAEVVSILGSQLAKFALSVLVYDRTNSATAAALTYATSYLPAIAGGVLLGRLGDRFSRRWVMAGCDLVRAALFALMAVPSMPLGAVIPMLAVAVLFDPAFSSAEVSLLADSLPAEQFRTATAMRTSASQLLQVAGFAFGGALVTAFHPAGALVIDAITFVVSAALVTLLIGEPSRGRHALQSGAAVRRLPETPSEGDRVGHQRGEPFRGLWREPRTRVCMVFSVLVGLFVLPEALVVPFGAQIGASTVQTGLLLAMIPLGSAVGAALIVRIPRRVRLRVAGWMAVFSGVPLLASGLGPVWWLAGICWFVSGLLTAYQVEAISVLVDAIPADARGRLLGVVSSWLIGSQGAGFAVGGLLARYLSPGAAIAWGAAAGAIAALIVVRGLLRRVEPAPSSGRE